MASNPLEFKGMAPSKEDLEDYLGPGRYRRFDAIYEELVDMHFVAKPEWGKIEAKWHYNFHYKGKKALFSIRWGHDFYFGHLVLKSADYMKATNDPKMTSAALDVIRKFPENKFKGVVRIEANLEKMNEHEGFFDLIPVLIKILA